MSNVANFEIGYSRYLDTDGKPVASLPSTADGETLAKLYKAMVLARVFDAKAIALQRTGRLGTFASALGQEAVSVGAAAAMRPSDVFLPAFREHGGMLLRGVTLTECFLYWGGDERGSDFSIAREDFPIAVPVGTHVPHAAGVALAFKMRNQDRAAVCLFGDGATSRGDVYEAMNVAGVWRLPVVFVIDNNQWAISLPRSAQTAAETLAQKAVAVGFKGEQVDGNDVIAVHHAVSEALVRARHGGGPTLIEALSYRMGDHTTVDDASRYRDDDAVSPHWAEDPVSRLRAYLTATEGWSKSAEERLLADCAAQVDKAAEEYLAIPPLPPEAMFDYLFEDLPESLSGQRAAVIEAARREAGDA